MAMWGKVFGGVSGFFSAGPLGAAVGVMLGHAADNGTLLNPGHGKRNRGFHGLNPGHAALFATAKLTSLMGKKEALYGLCCVVLSAKMAKCDGVVSRQEIDVFKRFFPIPPQYSREVGRLFDMARQSTDGYQKYAALLGQTYRDDKQPLEDLLGVLFTIARAQGPISKKEERFLKEVHKAFGLSDGAWKRVHTGQKRARNNMKEEDAYATLQASQDASNEELRNKWRQLIRRYHPDVMIAARASEEEIRKASVYVSKINAAWDVIKRDRDLS